MEFDALNLGAGGDFVRRLDEQILLGAPVLLRDRVQMDQLVELLAGRRMIAVALEEAFAFTAAKQVEQAALQKREHDRRDDLIVERRRPDADVGLFVGSFAGPRHDVQTRI